VQGGNFDKRESGNVNQMQSPLNNKIVEWGHLQAALPAD